MAPQRRTGGDSYIWIGRQTAYGTPITGANVFDGTAPPTDNSVAKLIKGHFPFVRNTLDPTSEETESESIIGGGSRPSSIISARGAAGEWEFELLPDDAIHLLLGWFNPTDLPTNTPEADQTLAIAIPNDGHTADWPGQLKIELDGAASGSDGKIIIKGQKRGSRSNDFNTAVTETLVVPNGDDEITSKNFYHRVDSVTLMGLSGIDIDGLTFLPDTQMAELTLNMNGNIFNGWSSQMLKAFYPYIAYDIIPNLFRLTIGANIRLVLGLLASYCQEARSLVDPTTEVNTLENLRTASTGILARYPRHALDFYPSRGTAVVIGNANETLTELAARIENDTVDPTAVTSVDIEGNHNYVDAEGFTGDPAAGKPVQSETETRTVTVNASIYHETDDAADNNETLHWQDIYFAKQRVPIIIQNYNWLSNGRQVVIESRFPNCELTAVPGLPIEGRGTPTRDLAFQANPSVGSTTPDEISMRFYSEKGFSEDFS